jgi:hypothetical protein
LARPRRSDHQGQGPVCHPPQIAGIGRQHKQLGRLRLVFGREGEQDKAVLKAECSATTARSENS